MTLIIDPNEEHQDDARRTVVGLPARAALGLALAAVVAGVLVVRLAAGLFQPHLFAGTVLQSPTPAPDLDGLAFADGEPIEFEAFEDDVVLLFFGYTNCPDVCPITLATASQAKASLPAADAERVELVMVSVDVERDSVDRVQRYVQAFDSDFLAVGGEVEAIDRAAAMFGVHYHINDPDEHGHHTVDHTGTLIGIGPDGHVRVLWSSDVDSADLAADLSELLGA